MGTKGINNIAICCMAGGYKNVFTHGVLKAFEESSFRAEVYASCSFMNMDIRLVLIISENIRAETSYLSLPQMFSHLICFLTTNTSKNSSR